MKRSWRVFSAVAVLAGLVTVSLFLMVGERMLRLPAVAGPGDDADGDSLLVVYNGLFDQPILAVNPEADLAEGEKLAGVVQDTEAALAAGLAVATDRAAVRHQIVSAEIQELETFIQEHPQSAWVPSLRAHLGMYYRRHGQHTAALLHWQEAWLALKDAETGPVKELGDYVLAHWTRLLLNLGRWEDLQAVYQLWSERILDQGPLSQIWMVTYEEYARGVRDPGRAGTCGVQALQAMLDALVEQNRLTKVEVWQYAVQDLADVPVQAAGLSLAQLGDLARRVGVSVKAVQIEPGAGLAVPSVVHWKQEHYGAIIAQRGMWYGVKDPADGTVLWLTAEEIQAESSGCYLVPGDAGGGMRLLSLAEASAVWGRSDGTTLPANKYDAPIDDLCGNAGGEAGGGTDGCTSGSCLLSQASVGGSASGRGTEPASGPLPLQRLVSTGDGTFGVAREPGMAQWRISEPFLNLWLEDKPLGYQPGKGPKVELALSYKQRDDTAGATPSCFSWGYGWNCNWRSYVTTTDPTGSVEIYWPGGSSSSLSFNGQTSVTNYYNNTRVSYVLSGEDVIRYEVVHADGSTNVYGFMRQDSTAERQDFFLTQRKDPQGQVLRMDYAKYGIDPETYFETIHLLYVVDADGRTNSVYYRTSGNTNLVDHVTDAFGRACTFSYNGNQHLTNIQDVVQINSGFTYDGAGWPLTMTTPYGTTSFNIQVSQAHVDRSVIITDPVGRIEAYALMLDYTGEDMPSYAQVPSGAPLSTLDTNNTLRPVRNTFYWDPEQLAACGSTNLVDFTWSELKLARIRHWLQEASGNSLSQTLDHEQLPSPDGSAEGQIYWYDYEGKTANYRRGTLVAPVVQTQVMPDATTWYQYDRRNRWNLATNSVEKWVSGGTTLYRTNVFLFSDSNEGVDLVRHIGPDNKVVAGYYYTNSLHPHLPLRITNALNEVTFLNYDAAHRLSTYVLATSS